MHKKDKDRINHRFIYTVIFMFIISIHKQFGKWMLKFCNFIKENCKDLRKEMEYNKFIAREEPKENGGY